MYELPDGRTIDVGIERYMVHELLFDPTQMPSHLYKPSTSFLKNYYSASAIPTIVNDDTATTASTTSTTPTTSGNTEPTLSIEECIATLKNIPQLVVDSVIRCDQDMHSNLFNNIVVAGGGSCVEGLPDRFRYEVWSVLDLKFNYIIYLY